MNRAVVVAGLLLVVAATIYAPWEYYSYCNAGWGFESHRVASAGYSVLWKPPENRDGYATRIYPSHYLAQIGLAALVSGVAITLLYRRRRVRAPEKEL
ncbi:MAG: hypothetical protein V2A76_03965 [Planctomycetota bacterium]